MADATGVYRGRLRSGRGARARVYVRAAPRNGLGGSRRSGKESRLEGVEIARVRNGAGAW